MQIEYEMSLQDIRKELGFVLTFIQLKYLSALMIMSTTITASVLAATPKAVLPCFNLKTNSVSNILCLHLECVGIPIRIQV